MESVRELKEKLQESGGKDESVRYELMQKIEEENKRDLVYNRIVGKQL